MTTVVETPGTVGEQTPRRAGRRGGPQIGRAHV